MSHHDTKALFPSFNTTPPTPMQFFEHLRDKSYPQPLACELFTDYCEDQSLPLEGNLEHLLLVLAGNAALSANTVNDINTAFPLPPVVTP